MESEQSYANFTGELIVIHAAIGGMQLKHWTGYFKIIVPTMKVLKAAKRAEGCVSADMFKAGNVFFAVSVWKNKELMQTFARSGLHGQLTQIAMDQMAMFFNHSEAFENVPSRNESVSAWKEAIAARERKGTVGFYSG